MKHLDDIAALVQTLRQSKKVHALIIQSSHGWAKSTTIDRILREQNVSFRSLGSYSTPLALYNTFCETKEEILVLDDCSGVFNEPTSLSILKAATWPSAGSWERRVAWASTSDKVKLPSAVFTGKLILLVNSIPLGIEMQAFLSRTLYLKIRFSVEEATEMLLEAVESTQYFENTVTAKLVADYLITRISANTVEQINLRTLQLGYEVAITHPETWPSLLEKLLPPSSPIQVARELLLSEVGPEEKAREFIRKTGLSRRTFFNYRDELLSEDKEHTSCSSV